MTTDPGTANLRRRDTITEVRAASAAAHAARATPGVVRLQPGVWGLVRQLTREAWEQATGHAYPDLGGVEVQLNGDTVAVELTLVTDGRRSAATTAAAVQQAVTDAVPAHTELVVRSVAVHVCQIDLTHNPR